MSDDEQTVDSLDDEIGALIDAQGEDVAEETPEEMEAALNETDESPEAEETEEAEAPAEEPTTVEEALEALSAPERWAGQYKEAFNALNNLQGVKGLPEGFDPRGVQQAWLDYHTERQSYATQLENERNHYGQALQEFQEVVAPYQQSWEMAGMSPAQGVRQLMGWAGAIQQDPQAAIERLAKTCGVDLAGYAAQKARENEWKDPQVHELTNEVAQLKDHILASQQRTVQEQQAATQTAIDQQLTEFASAKDEHGELRYPDYEVLDRDMAGLYIAAAQQYQQGQRQEMPSLEELYETAAWANPDIRAKRLAAQVQEQSAQTQSAAAKAATASRSVKSKGTSSGTESALSLDEEVGALIDEQMNR